MPKIKHDAIDVLTEKELTDAMFQFETDKILSKYKEKHNEILISKNKDEVSKLRFIIDKLEDALYIINLKQDHPEKYKDILKIEKAWQDTKDV